MGAGWQKKGGFSRFFDTEFSTILTFQNVEMKIRQILRHNAKTIYDSINSFVTTEKTSLKIQKIHPCEKMCRTFYELSHTGCEKIEKTYEKPPKSYKKPPKAEEMERR